MKRTHHPRKNILPWVMGREVEGYTYYRALSSGGGRRSLLCYRDKSIEVTCGLGTWKGQFRPTNYPIIIVGINYFDRFDHHSWLSFIEIDW